MIRQVRIGLTLLLAGVLAVVAFTSALGGLRWTSERASSRSSEASKDVTVTAPIDQQAIAAPSRETTAHLSNIERNQVIFADWVHPVSTHPQVEHRAPVPHMIHVQSGDTLWSLANEYTTTVSDLIAVNHLASDTLHIGQAIEIPTASQVHSLKAQNVSTGGPLTYTVMPGDTLWRISLAYGVSVATLEQTNQIASSDLHVGEKLTIAAPLANYTPTKASLTLIQHAPPSLLAVYQAAGKKYDIPWTVLAAIHKEETDFDCTGQDVSSAGALGPMQFMPSTFAIYGVAAPGHTVPNIHNVDDAIYSTAHMLSAEGFDRDPYHAIYQYNHSVVYVHDILRMSAV